MTEEQSAAGRAGTPALKIADNRFSDVGRQGHLCPVPTFAAEGDAAGLPVDVIEGQPYDLIGTEAQPGEQQQDGVIPHAGGTVLIALGQHLANLV